MTNTNNWAKKYVFFVILVLLVGLSSCSSSSYGSSSSSDGVAQITAFSLSNDSFPAIEDASFRIYERGTDSIGEIVNLDSMPVGTPLTAVHPSFTFYATPSVAYITISHFRDTAVTHINPDSVFTKSLTSKDTLNFAADSIFVTIISADGKTTKIYRILPLVHSADPDKYHWTKKSESVYPVHDDDIQQLLWNSDRDQLMLFVSNGSETPRLYTCPASRVLTGGDWTKHTVSGLPGDCSVRQIIRDASGFYYGAGKTIYTSTDGQQWTAQSVNRDIMATMFTFAADKSGTVYPWFITRDDKNLFALAYWNGSAMNDFLSLQEDSMPVSGFSVVHFESASGRSRLIVLGGMTDDGVMLRKRWSLENSELIGTRLTDYSAEAMSFPLMLNASAIPYGDRLLLFGAQDGNYQYVGRNVYQSTDEGMHWSQIDTAKCQMPVGFEQRKNICAAVYDNSQIIVIGGSDNTQTYSDLYVGYKNSVAWEE